MDAEKIKTCIVSLSDISEAIENLQRVASSCIEPPLVISTIFSAVSDRQKAKETKEAIARLRPQLIFIVLTPERFEEAGSLVNSLQEIGLKTDILAFLGFFRFKRT